jgi:hypothetical protein
VRIGHAGGVEERKRADLPGHSSQLAQAGDVEVDVEELRVAEEQVGG